MSRKKPPKSQFQVPAQLDVIPFVRHAEDPAWILCPDCAEPLELHQPDERSPDRLLGICDCCRRWFLIHPGRGASHLLLVALPDQAWFRSLAPLPPTDGVADPDGSGASG